MPLQWLAQLFRTLLRFTMPKDNPDMRVFSKTTEVTSASTLLRSLKENLPFLKDGLGNIIVTKIEYCKCRHTKGSPWEHEFLFVTLDEVVGARRTAFLMAERLMDDAEEYSGAQDRQLADIARHQNEEMNGTEGTGANQSSSSSTQSSTTISLPRVPGTLKGSAPSYIHSSAIVKNLTKGDPPDALDRLVIFPNKEAFAREMKNYPFDVLMVMDLTQSQFEKVTLERFAHLLQTTSENTPRYHFIFSQCYWYAYTIWRILEIAMQPRIDRKAEAERQCSYSRRLVVGKGKSVDKVRFPETIKAQWEAGRPAEDQEWAEKKQPLSEAEERCRREAEGRRREAEGRRREAEGRRKAEDRVRDLERELESLQRSARSANAL